MSAIPEVDANRLRHMLDAATKARLFVQNQDREDLENDEMLALALVRLLEILGEAAARVSPEVQSQLPDIPWRQSNMISQLVLLPSRPQFRHWPTHN